MKINTFKYFIGEGLASVKKNRVMSLASISTVAASLFIFGVFMLMIVNVNRIVSSVESQIEIKAFLKDNLTTIQQQQIENNIKSIEGVKEVTFQSKEQALEEFKQELGQKQDLANGFELDNPLPASFIIKVDKPTEVGSISGQIAKMQGIDEIKDGKELVDKIVSVTGFIRIASLFLMLVLGIIAVSLISNTIRLTVFARKREIGIMKYIGATDWFIRWPFIIEGIFMGLLGAILSILILGIGYDLATNAVNSSIAIFSLVSPKEIIENLAWEFALIGAAIGGAGSVLSLRKFLMV